MAQQTTALDANVFGSSSEVQEAIAKYKDVSFLKVLEEAKKLKPLAFSYLIYVSLPSIRKAFYKFFMGSRRYWAQRLAEGDDHIFIAELYSYLVSYTKNGKGPIIKFDPSKGGGSADPENSFRYYMYRYSQSLAYKLLRQRVYGGLTNLKRDMSENLVSSYEDVLDNKQELASPDSFTQDTEVQDVLARYLAYLKRVATPQMYTVVKLRSEGKEIQDIANQFKVTPFRIYGILRDAKGLFDRMIA